MIINYQDFTNYLRSVKKVEASTVRLNVGKLRALEIYLGTKELSNQEFESYIDSFNTSTQQRELQKIRNTLNTRITAYNNYIEYLTYRDIPHTLKKHSHYKKYKPPIDPLSFPELKALLTAKIHYSNFRYAQGENLDFMYHTFTWFLIDTGGRFNESASVRLQDVNLIKGTVKFTETKGKDIRTAFIYEPLKSKLATLMKDKSPEDFVFTNLAGTKLHHRNYREDLQKRADQAGINRKVNPHLLRHSFSVVVLKNGVKLEELADLLGHKNIQTTKEYYVHLLEDDLRRAAEHHPHNRNEIETHEILKQFLKLAETQGYLDPKRFDYTIEPKFFAIWERGYKIRKLEFSDT